VIVQVVIGRAGAISGMFPIFKRVVFKEEGFTLCLKSDRNKEERDQLILCFKLQTPDLLPNMIRLWKMDRGRFHLANLTLQVSKTQGGLHWREAISPRSRLEEATQLCANPT